MIDTVIGRINYHNPQVNGIFGMKSINKVFTPLGIVSCGNLHEYIDYYLGSYLGGRNESFIYGVVNGTFFKRSKIAAANVIYELEILEILTKLKLRIGKWI